MARVPDTKCFLASRLYVYTSITNSDPELTPLSISISACRHRHFNGQAHVYSPFFKSISESPPSNGPAVPH